MLASVLHFDLVSILKFIIVIIISLSIGWIAIAFAHAIDYLDEIALPRKADIAALPEIDMNVPAKVRGNLTRLRAKLLADLE